MNLKYDDVTAYLRKEYEKYIELLAEHNILHGCLGRCEIAIQTEKAIEYASAQLWRIKLSFAEYRACIKYKKEPPIVKEIVVDSPHVVDEFFKLITGDN
jgi:hypothetical protein